MRHSHLSIAGYDQLCMEDHNHDSQGWRLGRLVQGVTLQDVRKAIDTLPEPTPDDQRRCKSRRAYITEQLTLGGVLRPKATP